MTAKLASNDCLDTLLCAKKRISKRCISTVFFESGASIFINSSICIEPYFCGCSISAMVWRTTLQTAAERWALLNLSSAA